MSPPADETLDRVAASVVQRYLGVTADDRFLVVGDDATEAPVLDAIMAAAAATGCDATLAVITARRASGEEPPAVLQAAVRAAAVVPCPPARSLYHTKAKGPAHAARARGGVDAPHPDDAGSDGARAAGRDG